MEKNYTEWVNPKIYSSVSLGNKSITTDEYNKIVNEILHITGEYKLSITNLENLFNQLIVDVKNNIIPS